jgi:O-acetyl-ADP-ribose deacetylase (regulator of RNase III)
MVLLMITYAKGNLLDADVEAVVNTVNTVGVMGKGIALMFKEAFPKNFKAYEAACERGEVRIGRVFVTETGDMIGPKWIINFPTKKHWRQRTKMEWITEGLKDLRRVIEERKIRSIAVPPLGCGNGGLDWNDVQPAIEDALGSLPGIKVIVYEPTVEYQNVAKRAGVERLTPARALVAELVRRYWVLGIDCSLLEIQKLAWFLERSIKRLALEDPLDLRFEADKYGPYAHRLSHLLNALDGSYLHCNKRIADASPLEVIWFDDSRRQRLELYLKSHEARGYREALETTSALIDGFQSPLGMELLATVDWLIYREGVNPTVDDIRNGLLKWPGGEESANRKAKLFDSRMIGLALKRLDRLDAAR